MNQPTDVLLRFQDFKYNSKISGLWFLTEGTSMLKNIILGITGTRDKNLSFVRVEFREIMRHPILYGS